MKSKHPANNTLVQNPQAEPQHHQNVDRSDVTENMAWESAKERCQRLKLAASTHHYLMNNEGMPRGVTLGKRIVRYNVAETNAWLESRRSVCKSAEYQ